MPYKKDNPPERIKHLPKHAQEIWIAAYNSAYEQYEKDEERANKVAWAAVKKAYIKTQDGKWVKKASFSFYFPICLSDAKIKEKMEIHIIPVGEWKHALYGDMKITTEDIGDFVKNFDMKIRKGVYITEGHGLGEQPALGWFTKLTHKGEDGLWGTVEWTKKGRELLEEKAYKYFSPEFFNVYEDPQTHRFYNNVLTGGALTNSPYFKELESIVMTEKTILDQFSEKNIMSKEEKVKELSEDEKNTDENEESEENTENTELTEKDKVTFREPVEQSSEKVVYQVINSANIELSEKQDLSEFKKELLRVGTWKHNTSKDGVLNVTKEMLQTIVKNFKDKVLDNVYVPLGHPDNDDPSKNTGEVVDLNVEGEKLMATVDIKEDNIVSKIKKGLIKCVSASIAKNYMKKDTGEKVGPTLFHAALVSEPYIKGMSPFVALSEDMKDSTIIPIMNMSESLTLEEITSRVEVLEETVGKIKSLEDKIKIMSEETQTKSETSEETPVEETPKEEGTTEEETPAPAPSEAEGEETTEEAPTEAPAEEAEEAEEETTEAPAEEAAPVEEVPTEETPKEELSEEETDETKEIKETETATEEVTPTAEDTVTEDAKSSGDGVETETEEAVETATEETKVEETETEAEEAKQEEVDLAEAEKMFVELLHLGKTTPAEKVFVLPLLASKTPIELSEGEKVASGKAMFEYLKGQSPKFSLSEEGTSAKPDKVKKTEEKIPKDVNEIMDKMGLSEELKKETYLEFKEGEKGEETTSF